MQGESYINELNANELEDYMFSEEAIYEIWLHALSYKLEGKIY